MSGGSDNSVPETSQEKSLANIATEAFARDKQVYEPLVNKYITNANVSPESQVRGTAAASVEQGFGQATKTAVGNTLARGGDATGALSGMEMAKTSSRALGQSNAISASKDLQLSRLNQVIGYGRGQATQAVSGLGSTAEAAQQQSMMDAQLASNQRAQIGEAVGAGAGAIAGYGRPSAAPSMSSTQLAPTQTEFGPISSGYSVPQAPQLMGH